MNQAESRRNRGRLKSFEKVRRTRRNKAESQENRGRTVAETLIRLSRVAHFCLPPPATAAARRLDRLPDTAMVRYVDPLLAAMKKSAKFKALLGRSQRQLIKDVTKGAAKGVGTAGGILFVASLFGVPFVGPMALVAIVATGLGGSAGAAIPMYNNETEINQNLRHLEAVFNDFRSALQQEHPDLYKRLKAATSDKSLLHLVDLHAETLAVVFFSFAQHE